MFRRLAMVTAVYAVLEVVIHTSTAVVYTPPFLFPLLHQVRGPSLPLSRLLRVRARLCVSRSACVCVSGSVSHSLSASLSHRLTH
jgi:hypothetical protein